MGKPISDSKTAGFVILAVFLLFSAIFSTSLVRAESSLSTKPSGTTQKKLVYLVSDLRIPFWDIMARGIQRKADELGYSLEIISANNSARDELVATAKALKDKVDGIIVSPTTSSACATILKLANRSDIPVVISDIGTDGGQYVSYISSNNRDGAYKIGKVLVSKLKSLDWASGRVGIVAIPQKRLNGQARTAGFMQAMEEAGIRGAGLLQQVNFSDQETYDLSRQLIDNNKDLKAIWLQGSNRYQAALRAIKDSNRQGEIVLITFDAEPEFLNLIPGGVLVGAAMQQPYLMGEEAVRILDRHLKGETVEKNLQLPILAISAENIEIKLSTIKRNVLGLGQN